MDRFELIDLKLERALNHINEFSVFAKKFSASVVVGFDHRYIVENGVELVVLTYRIDENPPPELGIIVGDCIHNLRSAVDNTVWLLGQMYKVAGSDSKPELIDFPAAESATDYDRMLKEKKYKTINAFPQKIQDLIRSLQPYNTTSWDALQLGILTSLWNQDKHRSAELMLAGNSSIELVNIELTQPATQSLAGFIRNGQEFARGVVPGKRLSPNAAIRVSPSVAFAWPGPAMGSDAVQLLLEMYGLVSLNIVGHVKSSLNA